RHEPRAPELLLRRQEGAPAGPLRPPRARALRAPAGPLRRPRRAALGAVAPGRGLLPAGPGRRLRPRPPRAPGARLRRPRAGRSRPAARVVLGRAPRRRRTPPPARHRSEEHTSELQSREKL